MKFLFRALDRVWSAACISVFRAFDMAEGSGHVVSRNLANVQVERSNQANLLVENDAFDRHAHARVSNLYVNQYYCCNAARFACLSRTHKWRKKKKKERKKEWKNIFLLVTCFFLYFDEIINPCSRFPLVYLPFLIHHNVNIEFRWISKDINFEDARGHLMYTRYSRIFLIRKHNLTIIFQ